MSDKRSSPRYAVQDVKGTLHLSSEARILNMSLTGMAVETTTSMRVGRTYAINLRHGEAPAVRLAGTVAWCRLKSLRRRDDGETSAVYEAGVRFDDTLSGPAGDLMRFLQSSAVVTVDQRIAGRFRVKLPEPANLSADLTFLVRTISTTGMLIEAEFTPPVNSTFDMELDLDPTTCRISGRIAYAQEPTGADGAKLSQLGIEFIGLDDAARASIQDLIADQLQ